METGSIETSNSETGNIETGNKKRSEGVVRTVELSDGVLQTMTWGSGIPEIVLLHDGLGSCKQWRDVPSEIAQRSGRTVMAYDRPGHGQSTPVPSDGWPPSWMQDQAVMLSELLDALEIDAPVLVGHSDGGSIALIHAGTNPWRQRGVVALAAHSYVEQVCVDAISHLRSNPDGILAALDRFHHDASATFDAWSGGWTDPAFRTWDVRPLLAETLCPVLVAQGSLDEYATAAMVPDTIAAIGDGATEAEGRLLEGLGHMLHLEAPADVVNLVMDFIANTQD